MSTILLMLLGIWRIYVGLFHFPVFIKRRWDQMKHFFCSGYPSSAQSCRSLYFNLRIFIHKLSSLDAIIQANFASGALLVLLVVLNPSPPFLLGVHSSFQAWRWFGHVWRIMINTLLGKISWCKLRELNKGRESQKIILIEIKNK